jgi:hypothetical protein
MAKRKDSDVLERYGSHRPTPMDSHIRVDHIEDWFLAPVSRTRDSGIVEESNFQAAVGLLEEGCGREGAENGWEIHRFGHWGPGCYEIIVVKPGSKAQKVAEDMAKALENYPVLSDDDVSAREYEATIENIKSESGADEAQAKKVFEWLWENNQQAVESRDDQGGYPTREEIDEALIDLGLLSGDDLEEAEERRDVAHIMKVGKAEKWQATKARKWMQAHHPAWLEGDDFPTKKQIDEALYHAVSAKGQIGMF